MALPADPKPPDVRLLTEGPLAIRDAPIEVGPLDLAAWMPPLSALAAPSAAPALAPVAAAGAPGSGEALAALAVEVWRMKGRLAKLSEAVPTKEKRPLESAVAKMEEALSAAGVTIEDPEGRPYHDGDPFEVLLFEPSPALARATVLQTVKPAVLVGGRLSRRAEVVVGTPGEAPKPTGGGAS
ncbi:MAG TPA: hypothetical protein VGK67_29235 [Myxococcales bacterium]|jgi:hypothetical protein